MTEVLDRAAELLDRSRERDVQLGLRHRAYREGYMEGGRDQWSAGYTAAVADLKRTQAELVTVLGQAAELAARRRVPGAAWLAAVERHGGTEYGGAGKPRVPVDPARIELGRQMLKGRAA